jgi:hypothetical protein
VPVGKGVDCIALDLHWKKWMDWVKYLLDALPGERMWKCRIVSFREERNQDNLGVDVCGITD